MRIRVFREEGELLKIGDLGRVIRYRESFGGGRKW